MKFAQIWGKNWLAFLSYRQNILMPFSLLYFYVTAISKCATSLIPRSSSLVPTGPRTRLLIKSVCCNLLPVIWSITERKRKKRSVAYITSIHPSLTHTWSYRQMETISTSLVAANIMIITLTSLWTQACGYFWMSFVNKLTPLPTFINSSWWCKMWCMWCICTDTVTFTSWRICYISKEAEPTLLGVLSIEASLWVAPTGITFYLSAAIVLKKALLKLGRRHIKHRYYDDIQSRNVTMSFKSFRYKWVISLVPEWIWHTMENQ